MKNATCISSNLPNICGHIYPIQRVVISYLIDIIRYFWINISGAIFVLMGIEQTSKQAAQTLFKMEESKFTQRVNLPQAIKYGSVLYIVAGLLAMPAGMCGHQHITPVLSPAVASLQLPAFIAVLNDMVKTHVGDDQVEAPASASMDLAPKAPPFQRHVLRASQTYAVDAALIRAIIMAESSNNPKAVSHRGARGLMQLMPRTAKWLGVEDSFNPAHNIDGGVRYFRQLLDRFGDEKLALAAYNAGSRHVRNYGGVPPFKATRQYIKKVLEYRQHYKNEMTRNPKNGIAS